MDTKRNTKKRYRILSLDGGGIRGILSLGILESLESRFKREYYDGKRGIDYPGFIQNVDLFAGTSTGGIIALALAAGLSPYEIMNIYATDMNDVFKPRTMFGAGILSPKYDNSNIKKLAIKHLGYRKLSDLYRKVFIATFNVRPDKSGSWSPKFLHNFKGDDSDGAIYIHDAAVYTSSAPQYFAAKDGYVDGGVMANNPSMASVCQVLDGRTDWSLELWGQRNGNVGPKLNDIRLLSVGTGHGATAISSNNLNWGAFQWGYNPFRKKEEPTLPLLSIMFDGIAGVTDYQCHKILGDSRYKRISPMLESAIRLDDVSEYSFNQMVQIIYSDEVQEEIDVIYEWLKKSWFI